METIQDKNRLIAEFMGAKILSPNTKFSYVQYPLDVTTRTIGQHKETYKQCIHSKNLEYHSDWNWLMEVVEKIENLGFKTSIEVGHFSIDGEDIYFETKGFNVSKIEAVYQAVVLFIVWYNSQSVSSSS